MTSFAKRSWRYSFFGPAARDMIDEYILTYNRSRRPPTVFDRGAIAERDALFEEMIDLPPELQDGVAFSDEDADEVVELSEDFRPDDYPDYGDEEENDQW